MTPAEYRAALSTLGLSQLAAGRWLNVSPKTAQNYASKGPSGPAARAIGLALGLWSLQRFECDFAGPRGDWIEGVPDARGEWIGYDDMMRAIDLDRLDPLA